MREALQPGPRHTGSTPDKPDLGDQGIRHSGRHARRACRAAAAGLDPAADAALPLPAGTGIRGVRLHHEASSANMRSINGLLMWLYLPLIFALFGLHVYVVHIDKLFPMMMVNGTVWWFLWINVIGFFILRRWFKRQHAETACPGPTWASPPRRTIRPGLGPYSARPPCWPLILFAFAYLARASPGAIFIVDYRFLFPFASDLTPYRFGMWLLYFPFLLVGFLLMGFFLHGQIPRPQKETWWKTFLSWSLTNTLALIVPLILFLLVQYVPLLTLG